MLLKEIKVDLEFEDLVGHIKWVTDSSIDDDNIEQLLSFRREGKMKRLINDLEEKGFYIPPMLVTTATVAPELIKFKEKRSNWVLKSDYRITPLLKVDKESYLSDKIFNYNEDANSILMTDGNDAAGYKAHFTRGELSEILESHNSELTIEDFMVYGGENTYEN